MRSTSSGSAMRAATGESTRSSLVTTISGSPVSPTRTVRSTRIEPTWRPSGSKTAGAPYHVPSTRACHSLRTSLGWLELPVTGPPVCSTM